MNLIDMHCDTLFECYLKKCKIRNNQCQVDLESMKQAGAMAQFYAIFLPSGAEAQSDGIQLSPYRLFQEIYQMYEKELLHNRDLILPAYSYHDIVGHKAKKKMSSILTVEDGQLIDGKTERLKELYDKGVRLITLLWNKENCIGFPNSRYETIHQRGLKPFGIEMIQEMNRLGIIIDVSHLSEGGFYDVARNSKKPFVASHSCVRAICDHSRNLTDDQLKCIAQSGGLVGVNFNSNFLKADSDYSTVTDIVEHIDYILRLVGSESVALGSDFDGITCQLEISDYSKYEKLVSQLSKRYNYDIVEKICNKNVLRILKECL